MISVAGGGAFLSRLWTTGDLCLPCYEKKYPQRVARTQEFEKLDMSLINPEEARPIPTKTPDSHDHEW